MIELSWPLIGAIVVVLVTVVGVSWLTRRRGGKLDEAYFVEKWQELQGLCKDKTTWPLAIINADKLVDEALKRSRYKGKTMGERLVSAQHDLTSNDGIWYGHKLRNKLVHEDYALTKQQDVKDALVGFRQALKDLGAMK